MKDRELMEAAAKAAGMESKWDQLRGATSGALRARMPGSGDAFPYWNPLKDDGDALRLAVKLRLQVTPGTYNQEEATAYKSAAAEAHEIVCFQQDLGAATRRAIVRAAAAMVAG